MPSAAINVLVVLLLRAAESVRLPSSAPGAQRRTMTPQPVPRPWPKALSNHVVSGIKLAIGEATHNGGLASGASTALKLLKMVVWELLIFPATMLPFAVRTQRYRSANAQYVASPSLEVYSGGGSADGPLVLFVHGGSWGQGAPWQYALLAKRLLESGGASRVALAKYALFPEGDVDSMLSDVERALDWCRDEQRAAEASGRCLPVVLAGHSAGAHLCALTFARRSARTALTTSGGSDADAWRPTKFVALSGVFDIAAHFAHERTRLVHWLSPMWLAMIGKSGGELAQKGSMPDVVSDALDRQQAPPSEASHPDAAAHDAACIEDVAKSAAWPSGRLDDWAETELLAWAAASPTRLLRLQRTGPLDSPAAVEAASSWPPTTILHAVDDGTVPVRSPREFAEELQAVGVPCALQEHAKAGHGEIMIALMSRKDDDELPAIARDFVRLACSVAG